MVATTTPPKRQSGHVLSQQVKWSQQPHIQKGNLVMCSRDEPNAESERNVEQASKEEIRSCAFSVSEMVATTTHPKRQSGHVLSHQVKWSQQPHIQRGNLVMCSPDEHNAESERNVEQASKEAIWSCAHRMNT